MSEDVTMNCMAVWCFLLVSILPQGRTLRLIGINVPSHVRRGEMVLLQCQYDLQKDRLYSASWYKDHEEFYRFVPKSNPPQHSYPMDGINLDLKLSDHQQVLLKDVSLKASGLYRCEVSAEAPSFSSVNGEAKMEVYALPQEPPLITGEQKVYQVGDIINLNCTSAQSYPPARLRWYVNDILVGPDYESVAVHQHGLMTSIVGLKLQVAPGHFSGGRLQVRCVATISTGAEESNIAPAPAPVQLHRLAAASTPPPLDYNKEALFSVQGSSKRESAPALLIFAVTSLMIWLTT